MTTSPRRQIAWPGLDEKLMRYFRMVGSTENGEIVLCGDGPPSPTTAFEAIGGDVGVYETPTWLILQCDIGRALAILDDDERNAVVVRWLAVIAQEDFERDQTVWQMKRIAQHRIGGSGGAFRKEENSSRNKWEEARRVRRRVERRKSYGSGMSQLSEILFEIL